MHCRQLASSKSGNPSPQKRKSIASHILFAVRHNLPMNWVKLTKVNNSDASLEEQAYTCLEEEGSNTRSWPLTVSLYWPSYVCWTWNIADCLPTLAVGPNSWQKCSITEIAEKPCRWRSRLSQHVSTHHKSQWHVTVAWPSRAARATVKGKIKGRTKLCALIAYPQQTWYNFIWDPVTISLIRYSVLKLALALTAAFAMGGAMLI